jgi:outer membrane protein assembly factor BamA
MIVATTFTNGAGLDYHFRMRFLSLRSRSRARGVAAAAVVAAVALLGSGQALAIGEQVTDVKVMDNARTEESTVRSIAGVSIGDTLEADTLDRVRERLNTSGLFADVNVWWEPNGAGVRINIAVKDKFPWAPLPTFSYSANNKALGLVFVHGNLFGRGKQMVLGGRIATIDSGGTIVYRDPAMFGSWVYWQMQGLIQRQVLPEYESYTNGGTLADPIEIRETKLFSYGIEPAIGIAWFRRVRTQVAWHLEQFDFDKSDDPTAANPDKAPLTSATAGGTVGILRLGLSFDFRAREYAVMTGSALSGAFDYSSPSFNSDFTYWRAGASWEHGIRFFRAHNFVYFLNVTVGHNLPFWAENTAGGTNSRGYLGQQFRGDTYAGGKVEYHFPLFSIKSLDFRALAFYDVAAVWFRELPDGTPTTTAPDGTPNPNGTQYILRDTRDQRTFPVELEQGFHFNRNIHNSVGGGLRFFLRSVAVPLVGIDAGYGIEARTWRFLLVVGV